MNSYFSSTPYVKERSLRPHSTTKHIKKFTSSQATSSSLRPTTDSSQNISSTWPSRSLDMKSTGSIQESFRSTSFIPLSTPLPSSDTITSKETSSNSNRTRSPLVSSPFIYTSQVDGERDYAKRTEQKEEYNTIGSYTKSAPLYTASTFLPSYSSPSPPAPPSSDSSEAKKESIINTFTDLYHSSPLLPHNRAHYSSTYNSMQVNSTDLFDRATSITRSSNPALSFPSSLHYTIIKSSDLSYNINKSINKINKVFPNPPPVTFYFDFSS